MFIRKYLDETAKIAGSIDVDSVETMATVINSVRTDGGRLFVLGVGGSAATSSHAVNDFRKICKLESYTPADNYSEITAIINDRGWNRSYVDWLQGSNLTERDGVLFLSVGGGSSEYNLSVNLVEAAIYANEVGSRILAITGKQGGDIAKYAHSLVLIPTVEESRITPHVEEYHGVILHLLVSHPVLKIEETTWESIK